MSDEYMLTTVDNPFNPFTQFDDWEAFDRSKGYFTSEYLARIAKTSIDLFPTDYEQEIDRAINEILEWNLLGIYRKYTKENFEPIEKRILSDSEKEALSMIDESNKE